MANRGATAAFIAQAQAQAAHQIHLVEVGLEIGTVYLTDGNRQVSWGGHDYIAAGYLLQFSDIEENATPQAATISVSLSGVTQTIMSLFLTYAYIDRPVAIYRAFLDEDGDLVADPLLIFSGRIDAPAFQENPDAGSAVLTVTVASQWVDFLRTPGRHTNHDEQQAFFPGDRGFEYVSELADRTIVWGRTPVFLRVWG